MKLGSLKEGGRDGTLVVVNRDLTRMMLANDIAPNLQAAIDIWDKALPELQELYDRLNNERSLDARPFVASEMSSPLPRAFQWADGSAYLNHMRLVRKARGAEMPAGFDQEPLLYQGGSDGFIGPEDPIEISDDSWGIDFESEVAIITDDVPYGVTYEQAAEHIQLIMLCNDVSLRNIMRPELNKGFGFFQSKPASAFSPVCVTPDELGCHWNGRKISLPLITELNGNLFGCPNAGDDLT
ncbi:MAG: fumarylacetoacetate hydrolase family protein, partial [Pseudomonadota bacterium]|nr:fumarylacetoacetate hydrolase family protein [Pseudomonadota bacterium]